MIVTIQHGLCHSCRGGMQRVIRSDTAHYTLSAHTRGLSTHHYISTFSVGYQHILSTFSVQPCMHPHTTLIPLSVQLVATYISTYTCIAQSETIYTNDISGSKVLCRSQTLQSEILQDPTIKKCHAKQYSMDVPCMENDKNITIPRIIC